MGQKIASNDQKQTQEKRYSASTLDIHYHADTEVPDQLSAVTLVLIKLYQ